MKGINLDSILCPSCNLSLEDVDHVFLSCPVATQVGQQVELWLGIDFLSVSNLRELFAWVDSRPITRLEKTIMDSICMVVIWVPWTYQNGVLFKTTRPKKLYCLVLLLRILFVGFLLAILRLELVGFVG